MSSERFMVERFGTVSRCSLNNPHKMNALEPSMGVPMIETIRALISDDETRVIIIRGSGGNFSSGSDIGLLGDDMDPAYLREIMIQVNTLILDLYDCPKPIITEVDGFALGGGLGLALAGDATYATERAKFCSAFIRIGAVPDMGTTYFLVERIGLLKAKELAYTGDIIGAEEALAIGLINKILPHEEISAAVLEIARKIAEQPKDALAWTKRNLNRARRLDLQTVLDLEAHIQPLMLLSDEHKRAIQKLTGRQT